MDYEIEATGVQCRVKQSTGQVYLSDGELIGSVIKIHSGGMWSYVVYDRQGEPLFDGPGMHSRERAVEYLVLWYWVVRGAKLVRFLMDTGLDQRICD